MSTDLEIPAACMSFGDIVTIETPDEKPFLAKVIFCQGWAITHGFTLWTMRRLSNDEEFTYEIHAETPVKVEEREDG
jgi:hypothetical protein